MRSGDIGGDAQALLLLCSRLALVDQGLKPLTTGEWNRIATVLAERGERPGSLLGAESGLLSRWLGIEPVLAARMAALLERGGQLALELERLAGRGIWVLSRADEAYPQRWKQRLKQSAPVVLFGAGPVPSSPIRAMAVVGSRDVDERGLAFTRRLATTCAGAGIAIVSGGARGTDAAAAAGGLEAGGCAVAVLADSLEKTLRKREMLTAVRDGRLTLLTTERPDRSFTVSVAMARNKLVYSLADWAVVISSASESGGTWAGATEALRNRWVPVFIRDEAGVPAGNRALLARGGEPLKPDAIASPETLEARLTVAAETTPVGAVRERPPAFDAEYPTRESLDTVGGASLQPHRTEVQPSIAPSAPCDVYMLIVDALVSFCGEARTPDDVARAFGVLPGQSRAWLARAAKERRLRRRMKPLRYEATASLDLFEDR